MKFCSTRKEKLLVFLYGICTFSLLLYSYTQIDLSLVITRIPWMYTVEKNFQYIGYFNRPLSAFLFSFLVICFFALYIYTWRLSIKNSISIYTVGSIVVVLTILLSFSYNAFSYDLFNYMFDAKIFTHYHQNPYIHKALDYDHEPMLSFMHWTHRTYASAYGPFWLILTIPISFIGNNIFIITFYLFKLLMSAGYIGTVYFIYKILQKLNPERAIEGVSLFAFNPLIINEFLVSSHNDILMLFFAMWALYVLLIKKYLWAFVLLMLSVCIKYVTIVTFPIYALVLLLRNRAQFISLQYVIYSMLCMMVFALTFVIYKIGFQPWYFSYILIFMPFIKQPILRLVIIGLSFLMQGIYFPYLLFGGWDSFLYTSQQIVYFYLSLVASLIALFCMVLQTYWLFPSRKGIIKT